jgi:hypothetical protein
VQRLVLAAIVGAVLVAPVVWPYWQAQQREGFARNLYEAARHAATPGSYVSAPAVNLVYGSTGWLRTDAGAESELFPGFVAIALAIAGLSVARRRGSWPLALSATALVVSGVVLSLGPAGVRPLYAALHRFVFGFQAIRAPSRFGVLVALGLSLLAALGMREIAALSRALIRQRAPSAVPCALLLALLALEYANAPLALVAAPPRSTPTGAWLRDAPGPGAVIYLPFGMDFDNTPFMIEGLEHGRPIVNGYSGQRPAFYSGIVDTMHTFPSSEAMWTLKDLDVRYVVTTQPIDTGVWPLVERARFDDGRRATGREGNESVGAEPGVARYIYELAWSDEVEARLAPPATPVPPAAGPIPFRAGEQLTYRVTWDAPTGTVTAGEVTLVVDAPPPGGGPAASPAWRFSVHARTAPWIARFFEADDRFITTADGALRPLVHERRLREGRRSVDQRFVFDLDAGQVRGEQRDGEPAGPAVRLWPEARDAITALYFARTLDLRPGARVQAPVFENGRHSTLAISGLADETITAGGARWDTVRLDVLVQQRVPRRSAPAVTVWLGRDLPRPLVAAEVRAVFGNLRIELTSIRGTT